MTIDVKIRLGLYLVAAALSAMVALGAAHGLAIGFLDEIGGMGP